MDVNWTDPRVVSLHERLAATIQREYDDSLTAEGRVADAEHLGSRAASEILNAATGMSLRSNRRWWLMFAADPKPSTNTLVGCVSCGATEGQPHKPDCDRTGVMRRHYREVQL